jgi:hypothetical protein
MTIEFSFSIVLLISVLFFSLHNLALIGDYVFLCIDKSCKSIIVRGVELSIVNSKIPLNNSIADSRLQYDFKDLKCKFSIVLFEYNVYGAEYLLNLSYPIFIEFNGRIYIAGVPGV